MEQEKAKMGNVKKKNNTIAKLIAILLFAVLFIVAGYQLSDFINKDTTKTSTDSIREEIVPVAELVAYEYNFTQILYFSDSNVFQGIEIPLTKNTYIATIDGTAYIGVDTERIECDTETGADGTLSCVTVKLPHSTIYDVAIDHDSLQKYEEKRGLFNPITTDDYNSLLAKAEKAQEQKVIEGGLLERSDERVEKILSDHIKSVYGEDIEVVFEYV